MPLTGAKVYATMREHGLGSRCLVFSQLESEGHVCKVIGTDAADADSCRLSSVPPSLFDMRVCRSK